MGNKNKFPEGTIFAGEYAFVPISEGLGGGFKTVKLSTDDYEDYLSDKIDVAEDDIEVESNDKNIDEINFSVNYDDILKDDIQEVKPKNKNIEAYKDDIFSSDDESPDIDDKNLHLGHRARLRRRFDRYSLESFDEHEVLEFLLYFTHARKDTNAYAHALINEFGSLENVFKAEIHHLQSVAGIGPKSALLINFCRQLTTYLGAHATSNIPMPNSTAMGKYCCDYFKGRTKETFIVLILDTTRTLQNVVQISQGTENETAYYPRNVMNAVLKHKANIVAIAHNHTGNSTHPSDNDIFISNQISKLLSGIGVPLIDHIICSGNSFTSLSDRGFLRQ